MNRPTTATALALRHMNDKELRVLYVALAKTLDPDGDTDLAEAAWLWTKARELTAELRRRHLAPFDMTTPPQADETPDILTADDARRLAREYRDVAAAMTMRGDLPHLPDWYLAAAAELDHHARRRANELNQLDKLDADQADDHPDDDHPDDQD
ncbi:MAG: hypothetical protein KY462_12455 [Actinobacteria bacterium]|nr:hypothetical protein [Actinomycetota bacterium]